MITIKNRFFLFCLLGLLVLFTTACPIIPKIEDDTEEDSPPDMIPPSQLDQSYHGTLIVRNTSTFPDWDESSSMDVVIDKDLGIITIDSGTLNYSGEEVYGGGEYKIERSGSWNMYPIGHLEKDNDIIYVVVDAGVSVTSDVTTVYELDDLGNWEQLYQVDTSAEPNSDLCFDFLEATISGSVIQAGNANGSITWTLLLLPGLD